MSLIKWDPYETLTELQEDVDRVFNRRFFPTWGKKADNNVQPLDWLPAVDIHEDKEAYHFDLEAPGMEKNQFDVKVENNALMIKGERKKEEERKDKNYYRMEREYGTFARSFLLPESADPNKINAEYRHGVLRVTIGKRETAKPKQIEVKGAV